MRCLKRMNIGIYIEMGGLNILNISNSMIRRLAALDQAQSHFRSENIKFGIHHRDQETFMLVQRMKKGNK